MESLHRSAEDLLKQISKLRQDVYVLSCRTCYLDAMRELENRVTAIEVRAARDSCAEKSEDPAG